MYKYLLALVAGLCIFGAVSTAEAQTVVYVVPAPVVVYVPSVLPPPRVEVVTVSPGPSYVWTNGYWHWSSTRYVWVSGRYVHGYVGRRWVQPRWYYRGWTRGYGHRYSHVRGHWR